MLQSVVINVSFPRSGHRFLREILSRYFGDDLVFFESYTQSPSDKCFQGRSRINYVKTHDFQLQGSAVLNNFFPIDRRYLIQLRHPLNAIASYYELSLHNSDLMSDSGMNWELFLADKLRYWRAFVDLWFGDNACSELVLYEDLTSQPFTVCARVIEWLTGSNVDNSALAEAIERVGFRQYVGDKERLKKDTRYITQFKYYNAKKFRKLERELLSEYLRPLKIAPLLQ
jgi:hypothetical protein